MALLFIWRLNVYRGIEIKPFFSVSTTYYLNPLMMLTGWVSVYFYMALEFTTSLAPRMRPMLVTRTVY